MIFFVEMPPLSPKSLGKNSPVCTSNFSEAGELGRCFVTIRSEVGLFWVFLGKSKHFCWFPRKDMRAYMSFVMHLAYALTRICRQMGAGGRCNIYLRFNPSLFSFFLFTEKNSKREKCPLPHFFNSQAIEFLFNFRNNINSKRLLGSPLLGKINTLTLS